MRKRYTVVCNGSLSRKRYSVIDTRFSTYVDWKRGYMTRHLARAAAARLNAKEK
jgi:hypothetical protein